MMTTTAPSAVLSFRVPAETKMRFEALAARHQLSESVLLAQLVHEVLATNACEPDETSHPGIDRELVAAPTRDGRITLRLRPGDRARAAAHARTRQMRTATYLALLVHNHVREAVVMPPRELDAIKTTAAHIAALGRQLRAFGMPNFGSEPTSSELRDLVVRARREIETAREFTASIVRHNLISWEAGHA